jgi:hypothetical protein
MTIPKAVTRGCLAALAMTVSLPGLSAPRFTATDQPLGSIAPIVFSNADLSGGTTKGYRPWFENGSWQGDLVEYSVTALGGLSTSVSFAQSSPTNTGSNWSALVNFAARENADAEYWDTGRKIITFNGTTQVPFRFTDAGIGTANKSLLDPTAEDGASPILNFVRGDRSDEYPDGAQLRHRTSILGDIIHSKPVYVGAPNDIRSESDYAKFARDNAARAPRVYVGANDGMLHVFDAANGNEVYAYVPSMLMGKLRLLTARPYPHAYYVDGEMSVRDAQINGKWRTVLAGSLGAGGKGFFALDITDPGLTSESANTGKDKKVLFEVSASGDNDLGDSFSRPVIAKLNDGKWYVVIGNGYNSTSGVAKLYLVNLDTLAITKISTNSGTAGNPNGLSSPSLLDTNRNGTADYAYVGDIDGNLWKFDLSAKNPGDWEVAYNGAPLHPTAGKQAITQAPQIALHPRYGYMIYFATGRLYTVGDLTDTSIQSLYGIWDSGNPPPNAAGQSLLAQTWDGPKTYNYLDGSGNAADQTIAIYNPDNGNANWDTHDGWRVDFPAGGYRVLQPVQVRANRVKATVYKPAVNQQGQNWLVEALLTDGGPNPAPIYDLNVDRTLNQDDLYAIEGDADAKVPMMWRQVDGIMSQVTIGSITNGFDTLFINYLQPSVVTSEPCTENCSDGFFNGHIDVQTYLGSGSSPRPLGGRYSGHAHIYDKLMSRVYVDFFDLVPAASNPLAQNPFLQNHVEIDSTGTPAPASGIGDSEEFIVLIANADFSPGGTLHIGDREWNVLDYQIQIHDALKNWNPGLTGSVPVDSNGEKLVFTLGELKDQGGTIRISFNDRAILDGGLHPTQSECVITNATGGAPTSTEIFPTTYDRATNIGRWRNGALTLQLVSKSYFTSNPVNPALAMVDIQKPWDLAPEIITDKGAVLTTSIDYDGDGDTGDAYEQIGGLLARNDPEHLWEAGIFWHFGDLSRFTSLGRPCYYPPYPTKDDPRHKIWAEAVALEQDNDPITATLAKRGDDLTAETLAAEVDSLRDQGCDNAQATCNGEYKILKSILDLSDDYQQPPEDIDVSGPDPDAPVVIEGGSTGAGLEGDSGDGSITEGTSYEPGRMSWTDIVK